MEQTPAPGRTDRGTGTVQYAERLHAPVWVWLVVAALVVSLAVAYGAALGAAAGVATGLLTGVVAGWALARAGARVVVTDEALIAGRARIPRSAIGEVRALDEAETRALRGPQADPRAYLLVRGWVATGVSVQVTDPADPTPYWLVSTRHPQQLAQALAGRGTGQGLPASR